MYPDPGDDRKRAWFSRRGRRIDRFNCWNVHTSYDFKRENKKIETSTIKIRKLKTKRCKQMIKKMTGPHVDQGKDVIDNQRNPYLSEMQGYRAEQQQQNDLV
jgi:hypothetical protein